MTVIAALLAPGAVLLNAPPAAADPGAQCTAESKDYTGRPWALQRVLLDELWKNTRGEGVRVAVIDTGVDTQHPQLRDAVDTRRGKRVLAQPRKKKGEPPPRELKDDGTTDLVGHGTKVAGIIAARPASGTGFVGLAPGATIIPIQQNDAEGSGTDRTLAASINYAVDAGAHVINISQDTQRPVRGHSVLKAAVDRALRKNRVVVASAGNDGLGGTVKKTYPASYPGVLAVASSDRNNERAPFSQSGDFVDVAAPGVDMVSTVPGGGHCQDNGTSFSAPYVAGVAALLRAEHPRWTARQIAAQIAQTAERSVPGRDRLVGWGVTDPVRAVTEDDGPVNRPVAREGVTRGERPEAMELQLDETEQERNERLGTYVVLGGLVLAGALGGAALVARDHRRRNPRS
ncbi:type VII secretion-associated serine protease mycosin [Streptomyces sp. AJS327]|uniref:type VII secretion-associated serine protease mycosin n=1 Tax=Streptomyces sp. AJS327 TaxID=2545265 RepID=UPI0021558D3E|nr:type VII secretion-associated serine protease mycosin [Streptomyces sp. AJS327]